MSEFDPKKLSELRVVDLRAELEKRGLDKNGVKKDLVERLQKALQTEGADSETYGFDVGEKKSSKRLSTSSSSCQGEDSVSEKADNEVEVKADAEGKKIEVKEGDEQVQLEKVEKEPANEEGKVSKNEDNKEVKDKEEEVGSAEAKTAGEPEAISLTLEEEEKMNVENVEAEEKGDVKSTTESDVKAAPNEQVQVEEPKVSTTPATPQEGLKKSQDGDTATNTSNGSPEESSPQKKAQSNPRILWITNVPKNTRANELKQLLSSCGKVVCAKVVVNARYPGSCCFGYVTMGSAEDATNVIAKLNNTEFNGQIIKIDKFENIKADNLNPARKKSSEESKKVQSPEKKEDKIKKSPEEKDKTEGLKDDKEIKKETHSSPEWRRSRASDRSSRGRRRTPSGERMRERDRPMQRSTSRGRHHTNVLTFDKIKEERERQRVRERERALREDSRRRHEEALRLREMREISRRQKNEAERLEREREKLRIERERIEREKGELIKLERERQRIEREKLEMEKMELQRSRLRLEEDRRAVKRPLVPYRREEPFEDRKRPANDRHFEEGPRFEPPPPHASPIQPKKYAAPKDFKRLSYDKNEGFADKRGRDYNSVAGVKYDRSFDNMRGRDTREGPPRESQTNLAMRGKESRFPERDRSPHFRPMPEGRERHVPSQVKTDRDHHYSESNVSDRWNHPMPPQSKFGSSNAKPWTAKGGTWRPDPPTGDRWNPSSSSSSRPMGQQFSGNSNLAPACPPPPGINNYSDRFDYNKSSGIRKY